MPRISPPPPSPTRQRRSSRSSDTRRLSGVRAQARRLSADWLSLDPLTAIDPHSPLLKLWQQVLLLALVYEYILLPYAVVFFDSARANESAGSQLPRVLAHDGFKVFYAAEALFLMDFYVKLNTGFYEDGNILRDASRSRIKYLTSIAFVLDAIAIVPLALIVNPASAYPPAWLEVHKLLRIWRVPEYFAALEDLYANSFVALKMVKVTITTVLLTHVFTCARVAFGDRSGEAVEQRWLPVPLQDPTTSAPSPYLRGFFWAFGLLTGVHEGELPSTPTQVAFTVLVLLSGFSLFSYLCAVFCVLSKSEHTPQSVIAQARMNQLRHILCYYHVPDHLQAQAVEYVKRYYTDAESNDREVVKLLCPSIANDIQVDLLRDTVAKIPLFKGCSIQFITALTSLLELVSLPADYTLFSVGDPGDCMYVVKSGVLQIIVRGTNVRELSAGSFFGEVSVFSKRPRSATVMTSTYCTLYKLTRFHIERVLEGYPQHAEVISRAVEAILSHQPGTATYSTVVSAGTSAEEYLLSTLLHAQNVNEESRGNNSAAASPRKSKDPRRRKLRHTPSTGPPVAVTSNAVGEARQSPVIAKVQPRSPKRPAIGRSKSTQNVSIARRERMSAMSKRSEREKTEAGNTEGPAADDTGTTPSKKKDDNDEKTAEEADTRSSTYVPQTVPLKRSQTLMLGRKMPQAPSWLLRTSDRTATAVDALQNFYDNLSRLLIQKRKQQKSRRMVWLSRVLPRKVIPRASLFRRVWIVGVLLTTWYNWMFVTMELGFALLREKTASAWYMQFLNTAADLVLWIDMYVSANLGPITAEGEGATIDPVHVAVSYFRSRLFAADLASVLPYWMIVPPAWTSETIPWVLRLPRLTRIWRMRENVNELRLRPQPLVDGTRPIEISDLHTDDIASRLLHVATTGVGVFLVLHVVACAYFGVTQFEGFAEATNGSSTSWLPDTSLDPAYHSETQSQVSASSLVVRQYARALFFAATTLTTLGHTFEPQTVVQLVFAIVCMGIGLLLSAMLVDTVHTRLTSASFEQKEFLVTRAQIESFLRSQSAPPAILQRVNAFLDYWWSSHRGATVNEVLEELPETIRREIILSMCQPAVQTLALLTDVRSVLTDLERVFVDSVDFVLYGQGEIIYRQGDYASGLFFLLDGEVCMITNGSQPRTIPKGGFFGTASLHLSESSVSYAERMTAISGCILLFVSRHHLHLMHKTFPTLSMALKALERRVFDSKLARAHSLESKRASISLAIADHARSMESSMKRFPRLHTFVLDMFGLDDHNPVLLFDPDAPSTMSWQIFIALVITMQSFKIVYEACFGVKRVVLSEAFTILCEVIFLLDMLFQSRLGFYEYGNKVMDIKQMRRRYFRSTTFVLDAVALVPLFLVNWVLKSVVDGASSRVELINVHKLVRLIRVTGMLRTMESKYLNKTLELRLLKIVYYTMLLAHTLGCIWFSFGFSPNEQASWLPGFRLREARAQMQYWSAVFWAFGVMTASATSNLPETSGQALFSSVTMLAGLGLFAYVIGNTSDVIEVRGADTRQFSSQLASLRLLLRHFSLSEDLQTKLKTYVFFQRFHSITQEGILESCLPPSLLTDIRLVHLQPMMLKVAFLGDMEASVTRMLVSQFLQELIVKDHFVCRYGDEGTDMYFVFTGIIEVLVPAATLHRLSSEASSSGGAIAAEAKASSSETADRSSRSAPPVASLPPDVTMRKVNELTSGSYFGEVALFANKPRTANVRARTSSVLYKLSRRSLELVFERYPEWKKRVLKIVSIHQEQQHMRNLYMAEQQHDEKRLRQEPMKTRQSRSNVTQKTPLPRRMGDRIAQGSKRLVRRLSSRKGSEVTSISPPPSPPARPIQPQIYPSNAAKIAPDVVVASPQAPPQARSMKRQLPKTSEATSSSEAPAPKMAPSQPTPAKTPQSTAVAELWIDKLLACTEVQSDTHVLWLRAMAVTTLFMAVAVPYRIAFDTQYYEDASGRRVTLVLPMVTRILEHVCEVLFAWDIWMNWNMKESALSMELYETPHRTAYQKQHHLLWDALSAFPIDHFLSDFYVSPWLRLNRCVKILNFQHYIDETYRRNVRYEHTRFVSRWILFLVAIYWCASAYFYVASKTTATPTTTWYQWAPPADLLIDNESPTQQLAMRLLRSFFFATTVFVKKGETFTPDTEPQMVFTLLVSFVGLLMMAIMIGEITNLYMSYISTEVHFRHHHIAVKQYLSRLHVGSKLRRRVHAFLASLWSSHRGVNFQSLLDELHAELRNEVVLDVANAPLQNFVTAHFRSLFPEGTSTKGELDALVNAIAPHLQYQAYPRDENVISEGSIAKSMYFVVKGVLVARSSAEAVVTATLATSGGGGEAFPGLAREVRLVKGDCFGERGLLGYAVRRSTVRTLRACDLFALTSEALHDVLLSRPLLDTALTVVVESYKDMTQLLRQKCGMLDADALDAAALLGMNSADEPWGEVLLGVVKRRQRLWLEEWEEGNVSTALYDMLAPMRQLAHPAECRRMFEQMLRLLLPHGSLYACLASVRNKKLHHNMAADGEAAMFTNAGDFQEKLPVMMSAASLHSEYIRFSMVSTVSSSGSREMSSPRRVPSRTRTRTPSLAAKMLPPSD